MFKRHNYYLTLSLTLIMAFVLAQSIRAEDKGSMKGSAKGSMQEQKGSPQGEMDPAMAEMMEKWQTYATPNENHKVLNQLVGDWDHKIKLWMDPNGPAEESIGTSSIKWIMNGRFIQHEVSGTSMGQPFSGMGLTGYDNLKQKYITIWLDNMGTGVMTGEGSFDQQAKKINDAGSYSCPMTNGQRTYRSITTFINENTFLYEMYTTDFEGNEYRSMQIEYTRS